MSGYDGFNWQQDNRINSIESEVKRKADDWKVSNLETKILNLSSEINNLKSEIETLKSMIYELKNKEEQV